MPKTDQDQPPLSLLRRVGQVLQETFRGFSEDECTFWSAALAYYGLLSIFPLLLFLVFLGSEVLQSDATRSALQDYLVDVLPGAADAVQEVVDQTLQRRGSIGIIGGLGLLWSASNLFNALSRALNIVWGAAPRPFWRRRLLAGLSVIALGLLFMLSITLSALAAIPWAENNTLLWRGLNASVGLLLTIALFWLLYHGIPNKSVSKAAALFGAVTAALLWQAAKSGFAWYLASGLTNYGTVYGSLASVIALVLWAYFSGQILFLGAELAAAMQDEFWPNQN
jgi:membrane protein